MAISFGCLLLAHGSRDQRTTAALSELAVALTNQLAISHKLVGIAYLELAELPLAEQIFLFAQQVLEQGYQQIKILPLFLTPGIHVTSDLPPVITAVQAQLSDQCQIQLLPYLGASDRIFQILNKYSQQLPSPQIFLAHGSRQPAAQEFLADMVEQLGATPAYWSCPPQLSEQVQHLAQEQPAEIGIISYFLFPGRTSTAINATINELQSLFPQIKFKSTTLLGSDPCLVDLVADLLLDHNH